MSNEQGRKIRQCPAPDGKRVDTGAVQFGDDWPGLFIRGDRACYLAMQIRLLDSILESKGVTLDWSEQLPLKSLKSLADKIDRDVNLANKSPEPTP